MTTSTFKSLKGETSTHVPVQRFVDDYCTAITENYKRYSIRQYESMVIRDEGSRYAQERLEAIKQGTANLMRFRYTSGKKYYKVVSEEFDTFQDRNEWRDGSVHAFVDKKTGEVYKPASWKAPAKHVRFDMRIIKEREFLHNPDNVGWAGGYLYMR